MNINEFRNIPTNFLDNKDDYIIDIFAQSESFVAITNSKKMYVMGWNEHGNLGTGNLIN